MSNRKKAARIFGHALTALLYVFAFVLIAATVLYYIPRDVIDLTITANAAEFKDRNLTFSGEAQTYRNAVSEYERSIQCEGTRYFVSTLEFSTQADPLRPVAFAIEAPDIVPLNTECVLIIESTHNVQLAPFLNRTLKDTFESNTFIIKGE